MIYLFRYMSAVQEMFARARKGEFGQIYEFRARLPKDLKSYGRFVEELRLLTAEARMGSAARRISLSTASTQASAHTTIGSIARSTTPSWDFSPAARTSRT